MANFMNSYCENSYGDDRIKSVTQVYYGGRERSDCGVLTSNELYIPLITYKVELELGEYEIGHLNEALKYLDKGLSPDPGKPARYRLKHR